MTTARVGKGEGPEIEAERRKERERGGGRGGGGKRTKCTGDDFVGIHTSRPRTYSRHEQGRMEEGWWRQWKSACPVSGSLISCKVG